MGGGGGGGGGGRGRGRRRFQGFAILCIINLHIDESFDISKCTCSCFEMHTAKHDGYLTSVAFLSCVVNHSCK